MIKLIRPVSISQLRPLPTLHLIPIKQLVLLWPIAIPKALRESAHLGMGFPLRCFQRLSTPHMATRHLPLAEQPVHQRCVLTGPLVLGEDSLNALTLTSDMDQTVSRMCVPNVSKRHGLYLHLKTLKSHILQFLECK